MIREEIRNIKSGKKELRNFGITMGIVLLLLGGFSWWCQKDYYFYFLVPAALFFLVALVIPSILRPINRIWMTTAILMSWVITRVILGLLFYIGITLIGLLARMLGKDFLGLKFDKNVNSYWIKKEKQAFKNINYEKQF